MRRSIAVLALLVAALLGFAAGDAHAQCILANPSFELPGSSGTVFGGWYQFGSVGWSTNATHGHRSARVSGPNTGDWGVSGYWQRMDTAPGARWTASVRGWHTSVHPLSGQSSAILNIEWRDASENLISYESHLVADASTPVDEVQDITVTSGPAPTGTASTRFLVAVLQGPGDPVPDAYFDQATFYDLTPPTMDDLQWDDFPGGTTLDFSGRTWRVKGPGYYGPGPNLFTDSSSSTWVDGDGRLHLTVRKVGGSWYSTEVVLDQVLGYGDYIFTTLGRLDTLDPNVVFGLFLWQYGPCYDPSYLWWNPYNEIDVEFSRWGNPGNDLGQFVAQPYDYPGNINRFAATFSDGELTSHAFHWSADKVEYRSWRGGPAAESAAVMIHQWTYTGPHIPRPEQPRVHLNLWQATGTPATNQEVVLDAFTFVPEGTQIAVPGDGTPVGPRAFLGAARPNPFNLGTAIAFTTPEDGPASVEIYDVAGRRIRTLAEGFVPAGEHVLTWDGRDESGRAVASGVYLYRLKTRDAVVTRRMVKVR